jgi:antitoxin HicB
VSKRRPPGSPADDHIPRLDAPDGTGAQGVKEAIAGQIAEAMKSRALSKARLAALLNTSRSQVDRLLDPQSDVTLSTLQRAADMVGRKLQVQLV